MAALAIAGTGIVIADEVSIAATRRARMRGWRGRHIRPRSALLLPGTRQIHTFGMKSPIDVVFCDHTMHVVRVYRDLGPRRVTRWVREAACAFELASGGAAGLAIGRALAVGEMP